jgi:hypothetical protein
MDLEPSPGIGEDEVARSQPYVRLQTIQRLEGLWATVQAHVAACQADERPVDPRYLDLGLRVLREEARLYRLDKVVKVAEAEDADRVVDPAAVVLAQLQQLEARTQRD